MGPKADLTASKSNFRGRDASYLAPPEQIRTGLRAYGLYGAFFVKGITPFLSSLISILLFDLRRKHSFVRPHICIAAALASVRDKPSAALKRRP
jgi:hypothetical protein